MQPSPPADNVLRLLQPSLISSSPLTFCLAALIHLCSVPPKAKMLTYRPLPPPPTDRSRTCRLNITMRDKVLIISKTQSVGARINPEIYDTNILSFFKRVCVGQGMDTDRHAGAMTTSANPLASLPAHITDGNH